MSVRDMRPCTSIKQAHHAFIRFKGISVDDFLKGDFMEGSSDVCG